MQIIGNSSRDGLHFYNFTFLRFYILDSRNCIFPINLFIPNAPFLYILKTSENLTVYVFIG